MARWVEHLSPRRQAHRQPSPACSRACSTRRAVETIEPHVEQMCSTCQGAATCSGPPHFRGGPRGWRSWSGECGISVWVLSVQIEGQDHRASGRTRAARPGPVRHVGAREGWDVLLKNEFEDVIARTVHTNQPAHARTTTATSGGPVPSADGRPRRLRPRSFCALSLLYGRVIYSEVDKEELCRPRRSSGV